MRHEDMDRRDVAAIVRPTASRQTAPGARAQPSARSRAQPAAPSGGETPAWPCRHAAARSGGETPAWPCRHAAARSGGETPAGASGKSATGTCGAVTRPSFASHVTILTNPPTCPVRNPSICFSTGRRIGGTVTTATSRRTTWTPNEECGERVWERIGPRAVGIPVNLHRAVARDRGHRARSLRYRRMMDYAEICCRTG
jgi:hypothetical protein